MLLLSSACYLLSNQQAGNLLDFMWHQTQAPYSVNDRVTQYGDSVAARLQPDFAAAGLDYPPREVALLAFKDGGRLQLYARGDATQSWRFVKVYPVLGQSGVLGPKLREGDRQVPEGIYRVTFLNANSRFHLSLRLNYPNAFDQRMAVVDRRSELGGDIMIHGGSASIGCLAVGNAAAEDLFILTALSAQQSAVVVISPHDFRLSTAHFSVAQAGWLAELYQSVQQALTEFPLPKVF